MSKSSVSYCGLIDSDNCRADTDAKMIKKLAGKALDNVTLDKVASANLAE